MPPRKGSRTKYAITDPQFLDRMIAHAQDAPTRGLIYLLYDTGMHISSAIALRTDDILKQGSEFVVRWIRPKTHKTLFAKLPAMHIPDIFAFVEGRKRSFQHYYMILRTIGCKAGYDKISSMTFRHTRCERLIEEGHHPLVITQMMGCTLSTVQRAYAILASEDLRKVMTK